MTNLETFINYNYYYIIYEKNNISFNFGFRAIFCRLFSKSRNRKQKFSKIYHIKTKLINCENCYEISYKKDREIIKIKVLGGEKSSETTIKDDIAVEIENSDVCKLFQGEWNDCPKICNTNEEACITQCGLPICQFDYNTIKYRKLGEECGGLNKGDCEFGLACVYTDRENKYGICEEK